MLVPCPCCGPRNVGEFRYVGESIGPGRTRAATPEQWRALPVRARQPGWLDDRELVPPRRAAAGTSRSSATRPNEYA